MSQENGEDAKKNRKRSYVKPVLTRIRLDSEVLLVKGCKTSGGNSKQGFNACRGPVTCKGSTVGS